MLNFAVFRQLVSNRRTRACLQLLNINSTFWWILMPYFAVFLNFDF